MELEPHQGTSPYRGPGEYSIGSSFDPVVNHAVTKNRSFGTADRGLLDWRNGKHHSKYIFLYAFIDKQK